MATPATGTVPSLSQQPAWSPADAHKMRSDALDANLRAATGHPLGNVPPQIRNVTPRYGMPGAAKGAIYALDPDDHTRGDALFFSRYPEVLQENIEAILASDSAPGRAYPAFQQMGAKGVQLSVDLWFCDAFMWRTNGLEIYDTALGTLAETARKFFEFYMVGHDGTGIALPPVDLFLVWGGTDTPIPIVIRSVQLRMEHFTSVGNPMNFVRGGAGTPMTVSAKVDMEINIPLRAVNPFQPRKPKPPEGGKLKKLHCPNTGGFDIQGRQVIQAIAADRLSVSPLSNEALDSPSTTEVLGAIGINRAPGFVAP